MTNFFIPDSRSRIEGCIGNTAIALFDPVELAATPSRVDLIKVRDACGVKPAEHCVQTKCQELIEPEQGATACLCGGRMPRERRTLQRTLASLRTPHPLNPATAYTSSRGERGLSKQGTATDESLGQTLKLVEFHGAFMGLSMACPNANEPQFPRESA